jgi:hypothetical protein
MKGVKLQISYVFPLEVFFLPHAFFVIGAFSSTGNVHKVAMKVTSWAINASWG